MDGDPNWHGILSQSVSVVQGHSYEISFEQAASQFQFYSGATTEQWQVCLGGQCQLSALMNNASKGLSGEPKPDLHGCYDRLGNS